MKIVNKQEFYKLPNGTLYSNCVPCVFNGLKIKGETFFIENGPIDFLYENLIGNIECNSSDNYIDILFKCESEKTEFDLDFDCTERDGLYDDEEMFAVYSSLELQKLSKKIDNCVG